MFLSKIYKKQSKQKNVEADENSMRKWKKNKRKKLGQTIYVYENSYENENSNKRFPSKNSHSG